MLDRPLLPLEARRALTVTAAQPEEKSRKPDSAFDWGSDDVVIRHQPATAIYFNDDDDLILRQHNWPDEDSVVIIAKTSVDDFLDKLCDRCGIPSAGKP